MAAFKSGLPIGGEQIFLPISRLLFRTQILRREEHSPADVTFELFWQYGSNCKESEWETGFDGGNLVAAAGRPAELAPLNSVRQIKPFPNRSIKKCNEFMKAEKNQPQQSGI